MKTARYFIAFALALFAAALHAQDIAEPAPSLVTPADPMVEARAAVARHDPAEALSRYLRVLSTSPTNLEALTGAGGAALAIGDPDVAIGFYARAEAVAPRDGRIKAGIGSALVQKAQPDHALRLFREAVALGVAPADVAGDRGLAYDLEGDNKRAQLEYLSALRVRRDDETVRRMALSLAISGDRVGALAMLDPLLRQRDGAAWRARAFVLAMTGDARGAENTAIAVMPRPQAEAMLPFLKKIAELKPEQKALAVHFGQFPSDGRAYSEGELFADAQTTPAPVTPARPGPVATPSRVAVALIPSGRPLGAAVGGTSEAAVQRPRPAAVETATAVTPSKAESPRATVPAKPVPIGPPVALADPSVQSSVAENAAAAKAREEAAARAAAAQAKAEADARARAEAKAEAEMRTKADAKAKADAEAKTAREAAAKQEAKAKQDAKAKAEARAKADSAAKAKAEREAKSKAPARYWVQVAGGANKGDLPRAWEKLKDKWPKVLAGKSPWTTPLRFTNRLLIGPFKSDEDAQAWVNTSGKAGFQTFAFTSANGQEVERVPLK